MNVDVATLVSSGNARFAPEVSVALTFDGGKQERVTFYRLGAESFASRDGMIAKIQAAVLDGIIKALDIP